MKIRWHGHSCFEIGEGLTVITDPHDGKSLGIPKPVVRANVVLVSHDHFDHNCSRIVKGIDTIVIDQSGKHKKAGLEIQGFETFHDEVQGAKRGRNIVYKFEIDGLKFCHLGDLGEMPDDKLIASMKPIDILFTPVGNVFTIGAKQAKELAKKLEARVIIPMHYRVRGLSLSINGVDDFISLFPEEMVNRIGNEVDFLAEDLPSEQEVWVFNI